MNVWTLIFQVEACLQNQITPDLSLNQVLNSARTWVHNLLQYLTIMRYPCSNLEFECGTRKPIGACPWPLNRTVWRWRLQHLFAVMKVKLLRTWWKRTQFSSSWFQFQSIWTSWIKRNIFLPTGWKFEQLLNGTNRYAPNWRKSAPRSRSEAAKLCTWFMNTPKLFNRILIHNGLS